MRLNSSSWIKLFFLFICLVHSPYSLAKSKTTDACENIVGNWIGNWYQQCLWDVKAQISKNDNTVTIFLHAYNGRLLTRESCADSHITLTGTCYENGKLVVESLYGSIMNNNIQLSNRRVQVNLYKLAS